MFTSLGLGFALYCDVNAYKMAIYTRMRTLNLSAIVASLSLAENPEGPRSVTFLTASI